MKVETGVKEVKRKLFTVTALEHPSTQCLELPPSQWNHDLIHKALMEEPFPHGKTGAHIPVFRSLTGREGNPICLHSYEVRVSIMLILIGDPAFTIGA